MFEQVQEYFEGLLKSNWTATSIHYENVDPPNSTEYVRMQIEFTGREPDSLGNDKTTGYGFLLFSIFTLKNKGTNKANQYADSLSTLFSRIDTGTIKTFDLYTQRVGERNNYYQLNAIVRFEYQECNEV